MEKMLMHPQGNLICPQNNILYWLNFAYFKIWGNQSFSADFIVDFQTYQWKCKKHLNLILMFYKIILHFLVVNNFIVFRRCWETCYPFLFFISLTFLFQRDTGSYIHSCVYTLYSNFFDTLWWNLRKINNADRHYLCLII